MTATRPEPIPDRRAAALLADTRRRTMLTQAEVAQAAGLPQSTVSAYESGRRQPTLPMLAKLLEAMGQELAIGAERRPPALDALTGPRGALLRRHRREITAMAARHGIDAVSATRDQPATPEVLARPGPACTTVSLLQFGTDLADLLGGPVRVVATDTLTRKERDRREAGAVPL